MKLLLQKNIWGEYNYERFVQSLDNLEVKYQMVECIPFTNDLSEKIDFLPSQCFGSTRFIRICEQKGYGVFPDYTPNKFEMFDKSLWINSDGFECKWGELDINEPVFLKPVTPKFFTGVLVEKQQDLEKVQLSTSFIDSPENEIVYVYPYKQIKEEVRFFVIGGQLVSGSRYKKNGVVSHEKIYQHDESFMECRKILKTVENLDSGFVIDLGKVDNEWKIVELNNLNSSGFYATYTDSIVNALKVFYGEGTMN